MSVRTSTDELTLIETGLWFALETHPDFSVLFKKGNREKMVGTDPNPGNDARLDADAPAVSLFLTGGSFNAGNTSSSAGMQVVYTVAIITLENRTHLVKAINQLIDVVRRAFEAWGDKMPGVPSVRKIRLTSLDAQKVDEAPAPGWTGALGIQVDVFTPAWEAERGLWQ